MSPRRCTIDGCPSVSSKEEHEQVTFHTIPVNVEIRKKWIENCRVSKTKTITKSVLVCSRHFRVQDFIQKNEKFFLKQGAVPTIFPWVTIQLDSDSAGSGSNADESGDSNEQSSNDTNSTTKVLSSIKPDKLSALKQRSVSADEHLTVSHGASGDKAGPRKSLDSNLNKEAGRSADFAHLTDGDTSKKKKDFVSKLAQGLKVEAQDFNKLWHNAKIMEVDHGEKEVLVHFEKSAKTKGPAISDEWIPMNSTRLRPIETVESVKFQEGDKCLARWTDSRKFPGTVQKVLENDKYEVLFDDGCMKIVKGVHMNRRRAGTPVPTATTPQPAPVETPPNTVQPTVTSTTRKQPHPIPKFDLSKLNLPEIPADGEWCCHWVNDTPIGREGYLLNADGNKRPTVLVDDWRLPASWTKHLYQRSSVSGKWDVVLVGPTNKRFRSKNDVKVYLEENGQVYNPDVYDFSIHKRRAKDLGVYVFTDDYVPPKIHKPSTDYSKVDVINKSVLDNSLEGKLEPFTGFAPIESVSALPPSLNSTLNFDTSVVGSPIAAGTPTSAYQLEEGFIFVGALKVQIINNLYRCPKEGCGKNFRKEINLQMHVKHYHDELSKQLGVCPNMTDLAYFRTVGNSIDDAVSKGPAGAADKSCSAETPTKQSRASPGIPNKVEIKEEPNASISITAAPTPDQRIHETLKRKPDAEIKHDDMKEKKTALPGDIPSANVMTSPQKTSTPINVASPSTDAGDKEAPPTPTHHIKTSRFPTVTLRKFKIGRQSKKGSRRQRGNSKFSRLKKIKRDLINSSPMMYKDRNLSQSTSQTSMVGSSSALPIHQAADMPSRSQRLKYFQHQSTDTKINVGPYEGLAVTNPRYINENGEVIKIVRMRQEEIINCLCTFGEEDGLMIQCELCLCWQHGACNGIDKESQVPEKYVCFICKNPTLGRKSMKYVHDQDWLYEGRLFHANYHAASKNAPQRFDVLRQSHTLCGNMLELKKSLHSLNVKINIAANKDHPKMYLWAKPWDETPVTSNRMNSEVGQDQVVPKSEQNIQNTSGDQKPNELSWPNSTGDVGKSTSSGQLTADGQTKQSNAQPTQSNVPEPEAAIDSLECQRRLLDHIQKQQNLIMSRMQMIDAQIIALESMDEHSNIYPDTNNLRTASTLQMLMENLSKMQKLYLINQSAATQATQSLQPSV